MNDMDSSAPDLPVDLEVDAIVIDITAVLLLDDCDLHRNNA